MKPALWILSIILVIVGVAGIVLPGIPGTILVFAGLFIASWIDNFQRVGWGTLAILAFLTALSFLVDFLATLFGAKRVGASREALVGAAVGTIVGLFFGFVGLIIGPFAGAAAGELYANRDLTQAGRAGFGTWLGIIFGTVMKIALAFIMIGIFLFAYFW